MKLAQAFYHLPWRFDVQRLQAEVTQFVTTDWLTHPTGFQGNSAIPLLAVAGESNDDFAMSGAMQPTPALQRCPYIQQVLTAFQVPLSRSRLMRVVGQGQVPPHRDADYHWFRRTRVHIPVLTDPAVTFHCDGQTVHMAAGEAWTFDNTRLHSVHNGAAPARIHLVFDTMGGETFWRLCEQATYGTASAAEPGEGSQLVPYQPGKTVSLALEPYCFDVLTPREVAMLNADILAGLPAPGPALAHWLSTFERRWQEAFGRYGQARDGELVYWQLLAALEEQLRPWQAQLEDVGQYAFKVLTSMLKTTNRAPSRQRPAATMPRPATPVTVDAAGYYALTPQGQQAATASSGLPLPPPFLTLLHGFRTPTTPSQAYSREAPGNHPTSEAFMANLHKLLVLRLLAPYQAPPGLDRPVFIVAAPRSGSMLLCETLRRSTDIWQLDDDTDVWIASVPALKAAVRAYESDGLTARDATGDCLATLQHCLPQWLWHAHLGEYTALPCQEQPGMLRLLSPQLANALRIAFLKALWPEARFIYVSRPSVETISSMMDGWRAGPFVTHASLPGWPLRSWSFPLPPGWRTVSPVSLAGIAAFQWTAIQECIVQGLARLPAEDWCTVHYKDLVSDPVRVLRCLCDFLDLPTPAHGMAGVSSPLPLSRLTLSPPRPQKWHKHPALLRVVQPLTCSMESRIAQLIASEGAS